MILLAFYIDQGSRLPQHAGHVALALATWRAQTAQLKEQIARFLHTHKDDARASQ